MNSCSNCGAPVMAGAAFCSNCGTALSTPPNIMPAGQAAPPSTPLPSPPGQYAAPGPPYYTAPPVAQPPVMPSPATPAPFPGAAYPGTPASSQFPPTYPYGQPSVPLMPAAPGQPLQPATLPGQQYYAPPSQPFYGTPYSQPLYSGPSSQALPQAYPGQPAGAAPTVAAPKLSMASLTKIFGSSPSAASVQPRNAIQRRFQESLSQYATNPLAGAAIGAVVAAVACIALTFVVNLIIGTAGGSALSTGGQAADVGQILDSGLLNLVAIEHRASIILSANLTIAGASVTIAPPLTILILIPAVCLVLGGYISAATDYSNQLRYVLARAAAVGPVYGILLTLIITVLGSQTVGASQGGVALTVAVAWPTMLLYGIIWGTLFSLIGGLIKIFGRSWRPGIVAYLLKEPRGMIPASLIGACAAIGTGILISLPVWLFYIGLSSTQTRFPEALAGGTSNSTSGLVLALLVLLSLPAGIIILAGSSGASINTSAFAGGLLNAGSTSSSANSSESLFTLAQGHTIILLAVLIPLIAYVVGGRVAARVLNSADQQKRLQTGALVGVWSAVLMMLLAAISSFGADASVNAFGTSSPVSATVGLNLGSVFLGALILGTVFAVIGVLTNGQPRPQRSPARWTVAGVTLCVVLAIAAPAAGYALPLLGNAVSFDKLNLILELLGGAMLALPALCFTLALIRNISYLPPGSEHLALAVAPSTHAGGRSPLSVPLPVGMSTPGAPFGPPPTLPPTTLPPTSFPPNS